jgi:hypothetical protein
MWTGEGTNECSIRLRESFPPLPALDWPPFGYSAPKQKVEAEQFHVGRRPLACKEPALRHSIPYLASYSYFAHILRPPLHFTDVVLYSPHIILPPSKSSTGPEKDRSE